MFALLLSQIFPSKARTYLIIYTCLLLFTIKANSQNLDSLTKYIAACETKPCLDTIKSFSLQQFLNEAEPSKVFLKVALHQAQAIGHRQLLPKIHKDLAGLFYYQGEVDSSFYYRIQAIKQFEQMKDWTSAGREYAELGYQYKRINLSKGFEYMRSGIQMLENTNDTLGLANAYNNIGVLYELKEAYDSALFYYQSSLKLKYETKDSLGIPYSLENIALILIQKKEYQLAESNLNLSLEYRLATNDQQGLLGNLINLAELHFHKKEYETSILFFNKALNKERSIGHPYAAQYCYEKMTEVYRKLGEYQLALESHIKFSTIKDSISSEQNIKNVERLTVQYETEKKEKEIELLSIENQLKESEVQVANNRLYAAFGTFGLLLFSVYLLFNRYQHRQRALLAEEKALNQKLGFKSLIEGEEKERKRVAQELHDGLGQLLSTARLNVSAMEDSVKENVTKQWQNSIKLIDEAVTEIRHISHNMMPNALISIGFEAAIKEQVYIINDAGQVKVHTNLPEEKLDLPESEAIALYRVIQEVLNNAIKYAEAKNIWLTITNEQTLQVSIKDDGKGFDTSRIENSSGIGWQNIKSRVEILNGEVHIHSELGHGSNISLNIAV